MFCMFVRRTCNLSLVIVYVCAQFFIMAHKAPFKQVKFMNYPVVFVLYETHLDETYNEINQRCKYALKW